MLPNTTAPEQNTDLNDSSKYLTPQKNYPQVKTTKPAPQWQSVPSASNKTEIIIASSEPKLVVRSKAKPVDTRRSTKTEEIKEQVIRYFIDPKLQVTDIKTEIDRHYDYSLNDARAAYENTKKDYELAVDLQKNNEASGIKTSASAMKNILDLMGKLEKSQNDLQLKMAYTDVKNLFENGSYTKRLDRDQAIFSKMLGAYMRIHAAESFVKDYADPEKYNFHPAVIGIIAMNANALMSKQLLTSSLNISGTQNAPTQYAIDYMDNLRETGAYILQKLEHQTNQADVLSEVSKIKKDISAKLLNQREYLRGWQFISKYFYPITLIGELGLYTFEASVHAFKEGFILMNQSRSDRGVHGGTFQEPLAIFIHDLVHESLILSTDNRESAFLFKNFAAALHDSIKNSVWTDAEKKSAFFAAHLLLHESDPKNIASDALVIENKNQKKVFDFIFTRYLTQGFNDLHLQNSPAEYYDYMKKTYLLLQSPDLALKYEKRRERLVLEKDKTIDPFCYDVIEGLFSVSDEKTKKILEARIIPGLEAKKAELKIIHNIGPDLKLKDFPKAYLNDLYLYKCHNYDPVEAFKSIREFMYAFKEKIYPSMSETPLDISSYKDFIQLHKDLSQTSPT
jgi:hypothetical protein